MGVYGQTNGASMPVSTGGKGTSTALPPAWNHPSQQAGFGNDYGGGPMTPQQRALWASRPQQTGPDRLDTPADAQAVNAAVQSRQPLPSTGGKGTSQTVGATAGGMQPTAQTSPQQNYASQQQPAWMGILAGILQRQQQQQAYRYQAPNYAQMRQQALPQGWQAAPVYTPPPPPTPPPVDTAARMNQMAEQKNQIYDPIALGLSGHTRARGGKIRSNPQAESYNPRYYDADRAASDRIEERGSAHSPSDVVERALAVLLRREIDE